MPVAAPTGLAVTPNGKYLYAATDTSGGSLHGFRIAKNGSLAELSSSPTPGPGGAFAIAIAPNGKTIYAGNRDDGTLNAFAISSSGALNELAGSPYPAGGNPFSVTVSPNGRNVYVGAYQDDKVAVYDVGAHGTLTEQALSPYDAPSSITALAIDPAGRYLYEQNPGAEIDVVELDSQGAPGSPTGFSFENHGDFQSIVTGPDQAPKAKFKPPKHATTHEQLSFNASASRSKNGIEYLWKFGDGTKDDTFRDKVKHAYSKPGKYKVKLTLRTQDGCSTKYVSAGVTPYCNGGKQAIAKKTIRVK